MVRDGGIQHAVVQCVTSQQLCERWATTWVMIPQLVEQILQRLVQVRGNTWAHFLETDAIGELVKVLEETLVGLCACNDLPQHCAIETSAQR